MRLIGLRSSYSTEILHLIVTFRSMILHFTTAPASAPPMDSRAAPSKADVRSAAHHRITSPREGFHPAWSPAHRPRRRGRQRLRSGRCEQVHSAEDCGLNPLDITKTKLEFGKRERGMGTEAWDMRGVMVLCLASNATGGPGIWGIVRLMAPR